MPDIVANGVRLHASVKGRGEPLCLIMGYRLSAAAWPASFLDRLAERFTVIAFDNRGTGRSDKPWHGYALAEAARDVAGLLDGLGVERAHLLGFSMGGGVAQEVAIAYPERAAGLVLFATFCGWRRGVPGSPSVLHRLFDVWGKSPEQAARQVWPVTYTAGYLAEKPDAAEAQLRREIADPTPDRVAMSQLAALQTFDSYARLGDIRAPTLVASGDEDLLVPPVNSRILADRIPRARLRLIPDLGHRAIWEAPEEMAEVAGTFLGGLP